jgi:RNA-directed DNA polymerase
LELSSEKTTVTSIEDGFDFLGQNVRKYNGKLLIQPSRKNVLTFLEKVRAVIQANKQATAGNLIVQLNPLIRGWANHHRHVSSKATFTCVDHVIFQALWRWARRRHPNKGRHWIYRRYFGTAADHNRVSCGEAKNSDGTIRSVHLRLASQTPIQRHIKVQDKANPYDPAWELYFG